jgi:leucyl aminopeptidase
MRFSVTTSPIDKPKAGLRAVALFQKRRLASQGEALDQALEGRITGVIKAGECDGDAGSTLLIPAAAKGAAGTVLVGLGPRKEFSAKSARKACTALAKLLVERPADTVAIALDDLLPPDRDIGWLVHTLVGAIGDAGYRFTAYKGKEEVKPVRLKAVILCVTEEHEAEAERACTEAEAILAGANHTRDLGNAPPNVIYPEALAEAARELAGKHKKLKATVLDEKELKKLGANAILAVGQGSEHPAAPDRAGVRRRGQGRRTHRAGRQGHHLRYRRHQHQAGSRHGRDEVRHVRCCQCIRHPQGGTRTAVADQSGMPARLCREHARWRCYPTR